MEEIAPGTIMDGLQIEAVAGRGGFSVVYRATDLASGQPRAVKVLSKADPSARRLLAREATLLAAIDHPAIVPFRGLRQNDEHDVLITDWIAGESLHSRLRRVGPHTADQALWVLGAVADPLDHLHRHNIVHRDMSPANVIVGPDGALTVIDLGIGHHVDSNTLTRDDLLAGTPKYLAPEIIRGERADGRADQYSVGVMLHELVTGESPFPRAAKVATALHHQLHSAPAPLDEIDPRIPTGFANAVLRSMQKDPADRFATMAEFAAAAGQSAATLDIDNRRDRETARETTGRTGRGRLIMAGGAAALITVGLTLWLTTRPTGDEVAAVQPATEDPATQDPAAESTSGVTADNRGDAADVGVATESGAGTDSSQPPEIEGTTAPSGLPAPVVPDADWVTGAASGLACNQLQGSDFANGTVPIDYFGDPPGRERVVTDVGFAGSWALEVGRPGAFGQYGEIIPVKPGETYSFVGWFDRDGEIADTEMGISFLTVDYQPLSAGAVADTPQDGPRFAGVTAVPAPADAGFAVPYLFKDGSDGVLIADELIFGVAADCGADIEAAGA